VKAPLMHRWPQQRQAALAALAAGDAPVLLALDTPATTRRAAAREQARAMLRELLGAYLGCAPEAVPLDFQPGRQPRLDLPGSRLGISLSHESGLTLAGLDPRGAVGIDLMRIEDFPDWQQLARDYLGDEACRKLAALKPVQRAQGFAAAWTQLEARLKCLGLALREWTPALQRECERCSVVGLSLAGGMAGAVAWRA
jgi:4'-phosphopantetheinyl transferase